MQDLRVYHAFHTKFPVIEADHLVPVQAGRALHAPIPGTRGDDSGESLSDRNNRFSELTVHYWAWKNAPAARYIGFGHYRRYFNFGSPVHWPIRPKHRESAHYFPRAFLPILKNRIAKLPEEWNRIVAEGAIHAFLPDFAPIDVNLRTLFNGPCRDQDWLVLQEVLAERESLDGVRWRELLNERREFLNYNMFILRYDVFTEYMEWLFEVLFEFESRIPDWDTGEPGRVLGYTGEFLSTIYFTHKIRSSDFQASHLQVFKFEPNSSAAQTWWTYLSSLIKDPIRAKVKQVFPPP